MGRVERELIADAPCCFIISPDLHRRFIDKGLPQFFAVQPEIELTFSAEQDSGDVSYALDAIAEGRGRAMLRSIANIPQAAYKDDYGGALRSFPQTSASWIPAEDDESFLNRLAAAIDLLQDYPDGKMTLTRAYKQEAAVTTDPFELYVLHAGMNGDYACSHFFCLQAGTFSMGSSPENILEIANETLSVDVVAATCKASSNEGYLSRELFDNPKQIKEHRSSLSNRQNRFRPFCRPGSMIVLSEMQLKRLRNVCHLHSVFTGQLLPGVTMFDLMEDIFPLLGARPKELLNAADSEEAPHRFYGGLIGHVHAGSGGCFLNIRNALIDQDTIHVKVGTGVISESSALVELEETKDKLSGVLESIQMWQENARRK